MKNPRKKHNRAGYFGKSKIYLQMKQFALKEYEGEGGGGK